MAKDLPYFKFHATEWLMGSITLEDYETQGVFASVCAMYWNRSGQITLTEIKRRLFNAKPTAFDSLIKNGVMVVKNDNLIIKFLDEQITELKGKSEINRKNGKLGGRPKSHKDKEEKPNGFENKSEIKANESNIERDKDKEGEKKEIVQNEILPRVKLSHDDRLKKFQDRLKPFIETYGKDLLKAFYDYWTEKSEGAIKMRFEYQKSFDLSRRLTTWKNNEKNFNTNGNSTNKFDRAGEAAREAFEVIRNRG